MRIIESRVHKNLFSENFSYYFNKETGFTYIQGKTENDNPEYSEFGPMIADIEITTKCSGPRGIPCPFCYKSNTSNGKNMSLEVFKEVFHKLPKPLTQIAFGADADLTSNPDIWKIMEYCRWNDYQEIIPNITLADASDEVADNLSRLCGAVAVSRYRDKNICYDTVKKLTDRGMSQVNIHIMISEETYNEALETLWDIKNDIRLSRLNAIVFLSLKNKGRGKEYIPLSQYKFDTLVKVAMKEKVSFGFDSCSAMKFLKSIKDHPDYKKMEEMSEPCESGRFSSYIDVNGVYFPCSFSEGTKDWVEGISVLDAEDFINDIWNHPKNIEFRMKGISNISKCKSCQLYNI